MTPFRKFLARYGRLSPALPLVLKGRAGLGARVPHSSLRRILGRSARRLFLVDGSFGDCREVFAASKFSQ